jgi:GPI ethanolamine phosphate transferase 1
MAVLPPLPPPFPAPLTHRTPDPDNTRTPLVAWGAGIRSPLADPTPSTHDAYSTPFNLSHVLRSDVAQADVAPLMAAVLGLDWPVNSVGVLPDVDPDVRGGGYLRMREAEKGRAEVGLVNAQVSWWSAAEREVDNNELCGHR